ncbi:MAG: efflux RND transporter periplasmic adaptor subunit [Leptospirales bacterium]
MERELRMWIFGPLGGMLMVLALSGCHHRGPVTKGALQRVWKVHTLKVQLVHSDREGQISGVVSGRHEARLASRAGGSVSRILVRLGERVKKGQILLELSGESQYQQVKASEANLEAARKNFKRIDSLYKTQSATQAEWDRSRQALDVARAQASGARSVLDWTRVSAPFSGVVSRKFVRTGDIVGVGSPLLEILENSHFQIFSHVPARWASEIRLGQRVMFRTLGKEGPRTVPVVIREIAAGSDPVSHTVLVRADAVDSPESGLQSGQYGTLEIPVGKDQAFLLPRSSILDKDGLKEVFVVENGKAYLRYVRTGEAHGSQSEVISGISEGETVVVGPPGELENGSPVREAEGP